MLKYYFTPFIIFKLENKTTAMKYIKSVKFTIPISCHNKSNYMRLIFISKTIKTE